MNIDQELGFARNTKEESATTKTDFCMLQQTRRGSVFARRQATRYVKLLYMQYGGLFLNDKYPIEDAESLHLGENESSSAILDLWRT